MKSVFQNLKKLGYVKIFLRASELESESLVVTLAENNPDLTALRFMNYPSLSDACFDVLANSCPGLEELNMSFRDGDREINKLSSPFPNLKQLFAVVWDNEHLIKIGKKFTRLEKVELIISNNSNAITDSGIERLVNEAKNLKYV